MWNLSYWSEGLILMLIKLLFRCPKPKNRTESETSFVNKSDRFQFRWSENSIVELTVASTFAGTPMLLIMLLIKISATYPWMLLICLKCCWYAWNVADSIRMLPICIECCLYSENVADTFWMLLISLYSLGSKRCESGRYRAIVDGFSSQCGRSLV